MSNPARELHDLYAQWRDRIAARSNGSFRHVVNPATPEGASEVMLAGRLLARIDDLLDEFERQGKPVGLYRRQLPDWTSPMLGFNSGWTSTTSADAIASQELMDEIEGFANYLDGKVPEFRPGSEGNLREILKQARALLEQDDSLDVGLRMYIHRLLSEIERALDDAAIGAAYDFAAGVERLYVAVRAAAGESKKATELWKDLGVQFTAGLLSSGVLQGGTAILGAITGTAGA